jgi:hypothetical protein
MRIALYFLKTKKDQKETVSCLSWSIEKRNRLAQRRQADKDPPKSCFDFFGGVFLPES